MDDGFVMGTPCPKPCLNLRPSYEFRAMSDGFLVVVPASRRPRS
jgi:hypothetical protein